MTIHVFVATTQGLVAINNLYTLPDAVPNSMVTAGGFSEPCPITNSYHSFVKLGSGVIEAEFGKGPYRIDLSDKISQGNSWQLGFYIAHACKFLHVLGDGNPQPGDEIFCATGAIRTADETVVGVDHVPRKIAQAAEQLTKWKIECEVLFLLPKDNKQDVTTVDGVKFRTLAHLDDLPGYLPDPAGWVPQQGAAAALEPSDGIQPPAIQPERKPAARQSKRKWLWSIAAAITVIATALTALNYNYLQVLPASAAKPDDASVEKADEDDLQLMLTVGYSEDCAQSSEERLSVGINDYVFEPVRINKTLCDIAIVSSDDTQMTLFIGPGSAGVTMRWFRERQFSIPMPASFSGSKRYFLIPMTRGLSAAEQRKVKGYLFELSSPNHLTRGQLASLFSNMELPARVFEHSLIN